MRKYFCFAFLAASYLPASAQLKWINVDSLFGNLPSSIHIFKPGDSLDGKPNNAYYVEADLKDKTLEFTTDTTYQRRLKPSQFYEKNNKPLLLFNCTFFSFATNQNLNVVIKDENYPDITSNMNSIKKIACIIIFKEVLLAFQKKEMQM